MSIFYAIYCSTLAFFPAVFFLKRGTSRFSSNENNSLEKDEALILNYKEVQDKEVIAILFDRYVHLVFGACMKYLRNEENARDAAMEIFEALPEKLIKHDIGFFKGWLYKTSRNHCLMKLRTVRNEIGIEKIENFTTIDMENIELLHLEGEQNFNYEVVIKYLSELKHEQRICLEMMYLKGKSYKEIAQETGFELNSVKSHIQNGKRNLKLMMEQNNGN
jgi:RNA polymerase sigma factor (sigma-70 family)